MAEYRIKHADGRIEGPLSGSQLRAAAEAGRITADTRIQQVGRTSWHRAGSVPALAGILPGQGIAPAQSARPAVPAAPQPIDFSPVEGGESDELTLDIPEPAAAMPAVATTHPGGQATFGVQDPVMSSVPLVTASLARPERPGLGDRILRATFQFARSISVIVIISSILVALGGAALGTYALLPAPPSIGSGVERPTMEEFIAACKPPSQANQRQGPARPSQDEGSIGELDQCAPFRVRVETSVSNLKLSTQLTDALCQKAASLAPRHQDEFLDGLVSMSEEYVAKPPRSQGCTPMAAISWYVREFDQRVATEEDRQQAAAMAAAARRSLLMPALAAIGAAIAALLIFLILPLLIQIERNTRAAA